MQVAEESLKLMRDMTANNEENSFMAAYSEMTVEVSKMRDELNTHAGRLSAEVFDKKENRVDELEKCLILFNQSFFKLLHYKQEMIIWKRKCLEKEMEFINFVTKGLDNEQNRATSL
jgi:dynactin complex subunit